LPSLLSIKHATFELGIGRSAVYELIAAGKLKTIKIGRRRLVAREAIHEFIADLSRWGRIDMSSRETTASPSGGDRTDERLRLRLAAGAKTPKFYTIDQVAEFLNVSSRTVRRWIAGGRLVAHRFGSTVRISEMNLTAFLGAHRAW
jgi:excisionase family DNA binding protein